MPCAQRCLRIAPNNSPKWDATPASERSQEARGGRDSPLGLENWPGGIVILGSVPLSAVNRLRNPTSTETELSTDVRRSMGLLEQFAEITTRTDGPMGYSGEAQHSRSSTLAERPRDSRRELL
jgi:hypothetical protein